MLERFGGPQKDNMEQARTPEEQERLKEGAVALAQHIRTIDPQAQIPDMIMFATMPDEAARELATKALMMLTHEATTVEDGHGRFIELRELREAVLGALGETEM